MFVRELHDRLVSLTNDGGIKYTRYEYAKIIISDSTLRSLLPPQLKQMSERYKVMCGCECCISAKSIHSSLLPWRDTHLKKLKDKIQNSQSRRSGEKAHHIYETYKNTVVPYVRHIYAKSYDTENATMFAYPHSDHALPHWKCLLWCCAECPCINLPDKLKKNMRKQHRQLGFTFITSLDVVLLMV